MKKLNLFMIVLLLVIFSRADGALLANYPLLSDGVDQTGNNTDMVLTNAPFRSGGIYCNGIYNGMPNYHKAETPSIVGFSFDSFSISFDFRTDTLRTQPVIICGKGYRWLGLILDINGTVTLLYNNNGKETSTTTYTLGTWYNARITYDGSTAKLFINGVLACSKTVALTYVITDTRFGTANYQNGSAYKGYLKNLKIQNSIASSIKSQDKPDFSLYTNYSRTVLYVKGVSPNCALEIFDITGKLIVNTRTSGNQLDIADLKKGIYVVRIKDDNYLMTGKIKR